MYIKIRNTKIMVKLESVFAVTAAVLLLVPLMISLPLSLINYFTMEPCQSVFAFCGRTFGEQMAEYIVSYYMGIWILTMIVTFPLVIYGLPCWCGALLLTGVLGFRWRYSLLATISAVAAVVYWSVTIDNHAPLRQLQAAEVISAPIGPLLVVLNFVVYGP